MKASALVVQQQQQQQQKQHISLQMKCVYWQQDTFICNSKMRI